MLPIPTPDLIESKQITEGATCEFKVQIDLDDARQKSNLVDDVVAFLNSGPGHIVVGVQERAGAFERYRPLTGNPELVTRRLLSILQDNIEPRPLRVDVRAMPVEGGFLLDIDVAEHLLRPHQNRLNGAFYLRTGAKMTCPPPLPRSL
ncbi:ATP-binding protein [Phenylobacterium sp.]|uniref:AlbA family DNA-binding domain-containing protein n=1 Tax=Phenylobacterium sp. TaxID=1871053 RepID=UPI0025CCDAEF|nr:ATP-binding protein [Phenylobacterium sp.]